jgi:Fic-DOC domain mobile mystery protein B
MTEPFAVGDGDTDGQTPITAEEREGLIPTHVTLRRELNELEQQNIAKADRWAFSRRRNVLDDGFLRRLHKRMFGDVWKWAGTYRLSERNLGVEPYRIETELRQAIDDACYWQDHGTYGVDELAARFHHRIVLVHPFPNGNGRWSRLAADLLAVRGGKARFTWGSADLQDAGATRKAYIEALQRAD